MKGFKMAASLGGAVLVGLGVAMAATNPTESAYEDFAAERLTEYVKDNVCEKAAFIEERCTSLVDSERSRLARAIAETTQRQDFIFFSLYTTELSVKELLPGWIASAFPSLPSYEFETVGVFQSFYTHKAKKI